MTHLAGEHNMFKVLLVNQATLHLVKNEALVSNIRAGRKTSIGGIDVSQTSMSTVQVCDIPYVGVGFFNENAVANIISCSQCIKLGMDPDYFKEYQTFLLYASDTSG